MAQVRAEQKRTRACERNRSRRPRGAREDVNDLERARLIVDAIIADLTDRRGLRHQWDQIDRPIRAEIRATWVEIARAALGKEAKT